MASTNTYDAAGRLTTALYDDGVTSEELSYVYDPAGRRTRAETPGVLQTYTYNRRGQVLTESVEVGTSVHQVIYTYDLDGGIDTVTYPSGRVVDYALDFAGRPTQIESTAPGGGVPTPVLVDATYLLPFGQPTTLQLGPATGQVDETFAHDWQFRRTAQTVLGPSATTLLNLGYTYDPSGNLTDLSDSLADRSAIYGYDDLGRLTGVTWSAANRAYEYDAIGNLTRLAVDTGLAGEGEVIYTYDSNGVGENAPALASIEAFSGATSLWSRAVGTDTVGNITTDSASTYGYDLRNHLDTRQVGHPQVEGVGHWQRRGSPERTSRSGATMCLLGIERFNEPRRRRDEQRVIERGDLRGWIRRKHCRCIGVIGGVGVWIQAHDETRICHHWRAPNSRSKRELRLPMKTENVPGT